MNLPRWMHRAYAYVAGYFWLPCPLCGEYFGGHEWRWRDGKASIPDPAGQPYRSIGICPSCTLAGRGRGHEWRQGEEPVWSSYKPQTWKLDPPGKP